MNDSPRPDEHLELRLPVRPDSVAIGRRAAAQFAEETGCADETLWRVRLAVSEALSNVVLHAHVSETDSAAEVTLTAEARGDQVTITVTDGGTGMVSRSDSPGIGLGLSLIAKSSDDLEIGSGADGGTVVRMTFLR